MKVSFDGVTVNEGAVTLSVTGIVAGLPAAPLEVTVTEPLYAPAERPDKPAALIDTLIEDGTVPLEVAASQAVPPVEVVNEIPDVPVTLTDCAAGVLPPTV